MHHQLETLDVAGEVNLWDLFLPPDEEVGGSVQCSRLLSFLFYLASPGTYGARVCEFKMPTRYALIQVYGPKCHKGGRLYIKYGISASQIGELPSDDIQRLRKKLMRHVRVHDKEFEEHGKAAAAQLFRCLGLPL